MAFRVEIEPQAFEDLDQMAEWIKARSSFETARKSGLTGESIRAGAGLAMTITLDLQPEIEQGLLAKAQARGVSLADYVTEIVAREAHVDQAQPAPSPRTGQALIDVCAEVRGLLSDDEIDTMFARNRSVSRPVDLS